MRVDRLNEMEDYILTNGTASIPELSDYFHISLNSVRRDISSLLERGNIKKVYGGVAATEQLQVLPYQLREKKQLHQKELLGQIAAEFIPDHTLVFLDSGTTVPKVIPFLAVKKGITLVTYSEIVIREAAKYPSLEVLCLGGRFNPVTCSFTGLFTLDALRTLDIPVALMAATGVSLRHGLSNSTESEAQIKKAATQQSRKVILMADHSKFSKEAAFSYYQIKDLYAIVTDEPLDPVYDDVVTNNGIIVPTPGEIDSSTDDVF